MLKRFLGYTFVALLVLASLSASQASPFLMVGPGESGNPPNAIAIDPSGNPLGTINTVPTAVEAQYAVSLTPAATPAAIGTTEQTFTVTGLLTTDKVIVNAPSAPTSLCPNVSARVSAANTIALAFTTLTALACTPAAGVYNIVAIH